MEELEAYLSSVIIFNFPKVKSLKRVLFGCRHFGVLMTTAQTKALQMSLDSMCCSVLSNRFCLTASIIFDTLLSKSSRALDHNHNSQQ